MHLGGAVLTNFVLDRRTNGQNPFVFRPHPRGRHQETLFAD